MTIQIQDELAISAMTDELRSLIYYSLCSLKADIERASICTPDLLNTPDMVQFRDNIKAHTVAHMEYIERFAETIHQPLSLVNSYVPGK